jgi:hypothetical protein
VHRGIHAHVGGQQDGFQLLVQLFVNLAATKQAGQRFAQLVTGFGKTSLQALGPAEFFAGVSSGTTASACGAGAARLVTGVATGSAAGIAAISTGLDSASGTLRRLGLGFDDRGFNRFWFFLKKLNMRLRSLGSDKWLNCILK